MAKTLAEMTPEEREQCVGMWAEWKHGEGREKLVVIEVMNTVRDFAGLTIPGVRFLEVPRHGLGDVTPRFDLPRAWEPDGTPSYDDIETAEVSLGHVYFDGSKRVKFPDGTILCRFVGEWWERKDTYEMASPEMVARSLNKAQRQALRRISRAQTIKHSMAMDPTVKSFYTLDMPAPHPDMNIVEWCDWEAEVRSVRPQLTEFGAEVLEELERMTIDRG